MNRSDSGFILPMTLVTITLLAIAALITGRTFGVMLRASVQERLAIEERLTGRNTELILDAWMADPGYSNDILNEIAGYDVWRTTEGTAPCPTATETTCWRVLLQPAPAGVPLRGGEAQQQLQSISIDVRSGCHRGTVERCLRSSTRQRTYERAVFSQYQLHYNSHEPPADARLPDGSDLDSDPDLLPVGLKVVFADGDIFNGPVRYSGAGTVQYCLENASDSIRFERLEVKEAQQPENLCPPSLSPQWCTDDACNSFAAWDDPAHAARLEVGKGDDLEFPQWRASEEPAVFSSCDVIDTALLLGVCGQGIADGDIISYSGDITINNLALTDKSITVFTDGDIIVTGDIETNPNETNAAGGPHVIALIGQNIILEPSTHTGVTFTNVALLARDGAVFARLWHQPCPALGGCPTFTLEGSAAMKHLGLYGQIGPPQTGWIKNFTYPTDFWQARPPWWPGLDGSEWAPVGAPAASSGEAAPEPEPEPGFNINPTAVTVTEGSASIASFEVTLTTQPTVDVTVNVRLRPSPVLLVTPATLTFTPGNWDTAQTVNVNASSFLDADAIALELQVGLTAVSTDGDYDTKTASVSVTVTDDDTLQPLFTAADATNYVTARDCIVSALPPALQSLYNNNPATYAVLYQNAETNCRGSVPPDIPLGEADPTSLPSPADQQALKDAIDALAVAAGLPQSMIDAAEGG